MTQHRALPYEFRFRDSLENTAGHGEQLQVRDGAFAAAMRERHPELFADDNLVFANHAPAQGGGDAPVVAPVAVDAPTGFAPGSGSVVVDVQDDAAFGFGGIPAPPSHDFPI